MDTARMHTLACEYARARTNAALEEALACALPLCAMIARKFASRGLEYDDLYQIASLALSQAIEKFDPSLGVPFAAYASQQLANKARNALRDQADIIRAPRTLHEQKIALRRAENALTQTLRRAPTAQELADALFWPLARVVETLQADIAYTELDAPTDDGRQLSDLLGERDAGFEQAETRQDLAKALSLLSEHERALVRARYARGLSQRQAAEVLGLSQMQVSRAERRILQTLKNAMDGGAA